MQVLRGRSRTIRGDPQVSGISSPVKLPTTPSVTHNTRLVTSIKHNSKNCLRFGRAELETAELPTYGILHRQRYGNSVHPRRNRSSSASVLVRFQELAERRCASSISPNESVLNFGRNWRHSSNVTRLPQDPTMGAIHALHTSESLGPIIITGFGGIIYQTAKGARPYGP
jgi:hypothetical protein